MSSTTTSTSDSPLQGWYQRAQPYPEGRSAFKPTRETFKFAVLLNSQIDPEGFTVALFSPDIAVDAAGRVLVLPDADFATFESKVGQVPALPKPDSFRNTWVVEHERTSQAIDRLLIVRGDDIDETSVQAYQSGKKQLKTPLGDVTALPDLLYELFGAFGEARANYERGRSPGSVVDEIKAILGDAA